MRLLTACLLALSAAVFAADAPTRVACVGDSITEFSGYPAQLQKMLDEYAKEKGRYEVKNFGVSGSTMLFRSEKPYVKQPQYKAALEYQPQLVVLMLGTNDTRRAGPNTFQHIGEFVPNAVELIKSLTDLPSKPKVFVCLPVPIAKAGNWGLNNENLVAGVLPGVRKAAEESGATLVDMHTPLLGREEWFPDNVHPQGEGTKAIACVAFQAITGIKPPVWLLPPPKTIIGPNLLTNPGAEEGLSGWTARGGKMELVQAPVHAGRNAVKLTGRTASWHGCGQDVTALLNQQGPGAYLFRCYLRAARPEDKISATVTMMLSEGGYPSSRFEPLSAEKWTQLTAIYRLHWKAEKLKQAVLYFQTQGNGDVFADDFELIKGE